MKTINTFIPTYYVESFKKFANKTQKNVKGFAYKLGKPYKSVFRHPVINEEGRYCGYEKRMHEVCELTIEMPEENNWRLLATYKRDKFMPTDFTKKLVPRNPQHGASYNKCDVCGHWCVNSYLIENVVTGDELQIGCECVNKFGLKGFNYLSKFVSDLYSINDDRPPRFDDVDEPLWCGGKEDKGLTAYQKAVVIAAAKAQYDRCPVWKKGERKDGVYQRSQTAINIEQIMCSDDLTVDAEYVDRVCQYALKTVPNTEFECEMHDLAKGFYATSLEIVYAFFMVKNYEEAHRLITVDIGTQVKVEGKVIQTKYEQSYYGVMRINTILTDTGTECERIGVIPLMQDGNETRTAFYALVKDIRHGKIILDRATKNPKKGIAIKEI